MNIKNLPILGKYVRRIDSSVLRFGFQEGLRKEIERSVTRVEVFYPNEETKNIFAHSPVIIAFNHPAELEVIVCPASLPDRKDIFMLATDILLGFNPKITEHLIPIYVRLKTSWARTLYGFVVRSLMGEKELTDEEKRQKNLESIKEAADKVKKGGLVLIAPNPYSKKWRPGIGWLINQVGSLESAFYAKAYITNTSVLDYLRLLPGWGKILPKIKVYFSQPIPLSRIWQADGKVLAAELEKDYNSWLKGLKK
jgi:hypothetical protein